jgi:amino acid transporter
MAPSPQPRRSLRVPDAVAVIVGIVIGAGIFRAPSVVASNVDSTTAFLLAWLAGGLISLAGALCYAELATTYPDVGGDYHFLTRAYGPDTGFLYAWSRLTVIQTGSLAVQAFVVGDYAASLLNLGPLSPGLFAAAAVLLLTLLNVAGLRQGKLAQHLLTSCEVLALLAITAAGFSLWYNGGPPTPTPAAGIPPAPSAGALGLAMVFVLLTYGGWNEAAFLSAELRNPRRAIPRALFLGIAIVTLIYLLVTTAMVAGLGLPGVASSTAVAADLLRHSFGPRAASLVSLAVVVCALSTINATMITGARSAAALGRDFELFAPLGRWRRANSTPANALLAQGALALLLVAFGMARRDGFTTMVDYTAPVFWLFFLLAGLSLPVLRARDPHAHRPFRVPLYPATPLLFAAACLYMLYASLAYTGKGALVGVAVLAAGLPLLFITRSQRQPALPQPLTGEQS